MSTPLASQIQPDPLSMMDVLRIPAMRRLWYAQLVSTFGDFLALFAVISVLTFRLHATPQQVTGVQIAYTLPIALLGVLAGVFVDRWPVKQTLVASDLLRCALCLLLLFAHDLISFYLMLASISIVSSFFGPAQGVTIRSIVPLHGLRSANALIQQVMFGMRIIGPALAAFIVASFGAHACYIADSVSFLASGCFISTLRFPQPESSTVLNSKTVSSPARRRVGSVLADMRAGIQFILHHAGVLFVILALAAGMFVIGCFGPLVAVYVRDSVHASTRIFGIASAMIGLGMFVGVNALNTFGKKLTNTALVYTGLGGVACGLCLLALLVHIWSTILGNLIIGFAVSGVVVPANTMIQKETPHELMGRVGSTVMSLVFTAQIAGLVLSGLLADRVGVRHVFGLCTILLALLMVAGRLWMEPEPSA